MIDDFIIDLNAMTTTCPNGITVTSVPARAKPASPGTATAARSVNCTRSANGKILSVHEHHELLAAARAHALTAAFIEPYRQHRPMVERSIAWLIRQKGRKVRYRGIARNQIGFAHRCAAVNLRRLVNLGVDLNNGWTITA